MGKCLKDLSNIRLSDNSLEGLATFKRGTYFIIILTGLMLLSQPGCLFKKPKIITPSAPIRVAFLPLNVAPDNPDLRWVALAAPIMLAKLGREAPDLEVIPLWEAIPIAAESLGVSRSLDQEIVSYIASRLAAKWSTMGELSPARRGTFMIIDFIPAQSSLVSFRYQKVVRMNSIGSNFHRALEQYLSYQLVRPLPTKRGDFKNIDSLRPLAEALDQEYGWFGNADPGKADKIVADLARSDEQLARLLFNPNLYPGIAIKNDEE